MSAKQEKRLRRAARGLAVTLDQAGNKIHSRGLLAQEHKRIPNTSVSSDPKDHRNPEAPFVYAVTAVNRPDSLRGIIRSLKKGLKSGTIRMPPKF